MDSTIEIREVKMEDAASVAALTVELGYAASEEQIRARLTILANRADHCTFVADDMGDVIGWVHVGYALQLESDPYAEIRGLVVSKDHHNKGIGKKLIDQVVQWAVMNNCSNVRLSCNVIRKETHEFYKHLGFTEAKEQKRFIKNI